MSLRHKDTDYPEIKILTKWQIYGIGTSFVISDGVAGDEKAG